MAEDTDRKVKIDHEKLKNRPRERVHSADFFSRYSNSMNIEVTFNEFKLFFGEIIEASEEKLKTEEFVSVIVTPEEALLISNVLIRQIEVFEATFGPIRKAPGE